MMNRATENSMNKATRSRIYWDDNIYKTVCIYVGFLCLVSSTFIVLLLYNQLMSMIYGPKGTVIGYIKVTYTMLHKCTLVILNRKFDTTYENHRCWCTLIDLVLS